MRVLVIDLGGTYIKYAVMDREMNILERGKVPTPQESSADLVEALGSIYDGAGKVDGIALCVPGIVDSENGVCQMGGALRYNDGFPLGEALKKRTGAEKIYIDNDAKCAAIAEARAGSLQDVQDGVVIIFGTMVGGGIIVNGKLHRGAHFAAGEVSYISSDRDAKPDRDTIWGNRCSVLALCRMFAEKKGMNAGDVNGETVFGALQAGDPDAESCLDAFTKEVAVQLFNLQTILDTERFAIGGGISAQSIFIDYIRRHLYSIYDSFPYPIPKPEVVQCRFLNDANLYGALQSYLANRSI